MLTASVNIISNIGIAEVLRWLVKTYTMMVNVLHHMSIGNTSLCRKYAMSAVSQRITSFIIDLSLQ